MREAVIVEGVRTPVGRKNGLLKDIRADDLAAEALKSLVTRAGLNPELIDDVILGCVSQIGEQTGDIARVAALIAGFPIEVPGTTIDRQCGSSQQAVHFAKTGDFSGRYGYCDCWRGRKHVTCSYRIQLSGSGIQ